MPQLPERRVGHVPQWAVQGAWNQEPPRLLFRVLGIRPQLPSSSPNRIGGYSSTVGADERRRERCLPEFQDSREDDLETPESTRPRNWPGMPPHSVATQA